MPTAYRIDPAQSLVFSYAWGTVTDADLRDHYTALAADPAFHPAFRQLGDFRDVQLVAALADTLVRLAMHHPFAREARRALVAATPVTYGLSRLYAAYVGADTIQVFPEMPVAEAWLGLAAGTADRLRPPDTSK